MTKRQMAQEIARYIFGCDNLDPIPWTEEELAILLEGEPWEDLERVYNLMVERPRGDLNPKPEAVLD